MSLETSPDDMRGIIISAVLLLAACQSPKPSHRTSPTPLPRNAPAENRSSPASPSTVSRPAKPSLDPEKLIRIDEAILEAIAAGKTPGGVLWVERNGQSYQKAFGHQAILPRTEATQLDTLYDMASLTKVIATAPAIAKLHETGKLKVDEPVAKYLPEFANQGKETITIRQLLTHSSGLKPGLPLRPDWVGNAQAIKLACQESLRAQPGAEFKYSDINYILLGEIVHRVSGQPLHEFTREHFYRPLEMDDTQFLPRSSEQPRIAPTTVTESGITRGIVHDPTSARMGGVAGHAGLFSTASDLARFARMFLNGGASPSGRVLNSETIDAMTSNQSPDAVPHQRGWGWDIASPYSSPRGHLFEVGSYGHTGWTGTSIWIDPFSKTFVIFLSNRNHPTEDGNVIALRRTIGTLAAEAVMDYPFPKQSTANRPSPPQPARNGIDELERTRFQALRGLKVGLITNHTGRNQRQQPTIDLLHQAAEVDLRVLFSPEHGIRGTEDSRVADSRDHQTGLEIFSLYGATRKPSAKQLEGLDALVFDIQDIGCRFYTYISTLGLAMEAAAEQGLKFFVLDRINPISGDRVEGPLLTAETSFVGFHPLPVRHGMTVGELARLFRTERRLKVDLEVIPITAWKRSFWMDQTDLPWINPSPNMRSLTQAALYPGIGLLEMTALSVGRGTDTPFELIGAPHLDAGPLAQELEERSLPGLSVSPIQFTPDASVFAHQECQGIRFTITDRTQFKPILLGLTLAEILYRDHPEQFDLTKLNRLLGNDSVVESIRSGDSVAIMQSKWEPDLNAFLARRAPHLLYD